MTTVQTHVARAMAKIGVASKFEAATILARAEGGRHRAEQVGRPAGGAFQTAVLDDTEVDADKAVFSLPPWRWPTNLSVLRGAVYVLAGVTIGALLTSVTGKLAKALFVLVQSVMLNH